MIAEQPIQTNRYPEYKDSGVNWLGEIPAHWELTRLGTRFLERRQKVSDKDYPPLSVTKQGVVPQLDNAAKTNDGDNRKLVKAGDFVINSRSDRKGSSGISNLDGSVSLINIVLEPKNLEPLYCNYLLKSYNFIEEFYRNGHGIVADLWTTQYSEMKAILIGIPPLAEQTRIAEFLDRKTAQIDQAIAQKERLIELLNERRQVMIHRAVTRGLNPNAPMKDSGIDRGDARWIGEIPAHWEVSRINWLFTEKDETGYPDLPLLIVSINSGVTVRDMDDTEIRKQVAEDFNVYKRALAGDIAFNKMRMWQGAVGVVPQDGLVSPDYVVARPNNFVNSAYYGFLFKTREYLAEFVKHSHGIAWDRNRLYWEDFKSIFAMVPPLEEQNQIVDFLNAQNEEMSFASTKIQKQIQKLQELKSTLINSAVTGKIKV